MIVCSSGMDLISDLSFLDSPCFHDLSIAPGGFQLYVIGAVSCDVLCKVVISMRYVSLARHLAGF